MCLPRRVRTKAMRLRDRLLRRDLEQELEQLQNGLHREWRDRESNKGSNATPAG
jgi:hypothetical protein